MRTLGWLLLALGVVGLLFGLGMDTTVSSSFGGNRVHNIGLLAARQNALLVGSALAIVGAILLATGKRSQDSRTGLTLRSDIDKQKCPFCAETIQVDAIVCRFCGRDLPGNEVAETPDEDLPKEVLTLMKEHGVRFERGAYYVGVYEHPDLEQAIAHAQKLRSKP